MRSIAGRPAAAEPRREVEEAAAAAAVVWRKISFMGFVTLNHHTTPHLAPLFRLSFCLLHRRSSSGHVPSSLAFAQRQQRRPLPPCRGHAVNTARRTLVAHPDNYPYYLRALFREAASPPPGVDRHQQQRTIGRAHHVRRQG